MNEDRIVGAGRNLLGKAERGVGNAVDSNRLVGDGIVDQFAGAVQHGYGKAKDVVGDLIDDAPGAVAGAVKHGRELAHDADDAVRERLGDNGPLYLVAGAVALFALGAFALIRSSEAAAPSQCDAASRQSLPPASAKVLPTGMGCRRGGQDKETNAMKTIKAIMFATSVTLTLAACAKSGDEKLADRVENHADAQADALKNQAAALTAEAKQVRETGKQRGDAIDAANLNTQAMSNDQKAAIINGAAPAVR